MSYVCSDPGAYTQGGRRASAPKGQRKVEQNRSFGLYLLLTIVTFSIYHYFFFDRLARDVNELCAQDGEKTPPIGTMLLLSVLTLGIYKYLWFAQLADRLYNNAERYDLEPGWDGDALCLWVILVPLLGVWIAAALLIGDTNRMARACNARRNSVLQAGTKEAAAAAKLRLDSEPCDSRGAALPGGLLGLAGGYKEMRVPLELGEQLVLGRDPKQASVILEGQRISRIHCMVARESSGKGYLVTNRSKNGIELDGRKITSQVPIRTGPGARLSLDGGTYIFKLL